MQPLSREKLKDVRKLASRKHRLDSGRFVCEGLKMVMESDCTDYIVVSENFHGDVPGGVPCFCLDEKMFNDIAQTQSPQGILAVCRQKASISIEDVADKNAILMCDSISDPGNLGTIIRTAENVGIGAVILSENCVDVYNAKVVRATMGAIFRMPIVKDVNLVEVLANGGWRGIALSADGATDLYDADFSEKVAIVVGSESHGVSEDVARACEVRVSIPMSGGESLNAAIAAGITLYEWRRQNEQI
jgi:TrmH family RNA methyltransferase